MNKLSSWLRVISFWPSDTVWRQRSGSTLAQVMACCLMAPSQYLNQCWLIISDVQWHSYEDNFTRDASPSITKICLKITYLKYHSNFPGANELINLKCDPCVWLVLLLCCTQYDIVLDHAVKNICEHNKAVTKWPPFHSWHFQMHFLE